MADLIKYPRGFWSQGVNPFSADDQLILKSDGDDIVWILYNKYVTRGINVDTWEFQKMVVATASRLFGRNQREWFCQQAGANEKVHGYSYKFLLDTIEYLATGRRSMLVQHWVDLIQDNPEPAFGCAGPTRENEVFNALKVLGKDANLIQIWCSHPDGLSDLLSTLYVLFGRARLPEYTTSHHAAGAPMIPVPNKSFPY